MALLERAFEKTGARVKFDEPRPIWAGGRRNVQSMALDVRTDAEGEFFCIAGNHAAVEDLIALDAQPQDKHWLLLSRENGRRIDSCSVMMSDSGLLPGFRNPVRSAAFETPS